MDVHHDPPVPAQKQRGPQDAPGRAEGQHDDRGEQVADGDTLQHARDAERRRVVGGGGGVGRLKVVKIEHEPCDRGDQDGPSQQFSRALRGAVPQTDRRLVPEEERQADDGDEIGTDQPPIAEAIHDQPEQKQNHRPPDHLLSEPNFGVAAGHAFFEGKADRNPDHEEKTREDQVGRGPAIPFGMRQGCIPVTPVAWVVDQDHACDGDASQHVKRHKSGRLARGGSIAHGATCSIFHSRTSSSDIAGRVVGCPAGASSPASWSADRPGPVCT